MFNPRYRAMLDFVEGTTLDKLDPETLHEHSKDILKGLSKILLVLEENKILHNDLYPGNFIYNPETRQLILIDFGLAYKIGDRDTPDAEALDMHYSTLFRPIQGGKEKYNPDSLIHNYDIEGLPPHLAAFLTRASIYNPKNRLTPHELEASLRN